MRCVHVSGLVLVCAVMTLSGRAPGQPAAPPTPAKYRVQLRYEINAPRDPHVAFYDAMIQHLQALGFEFTPPLDRHPDTDREDPNKNQIVGLLPSGNVLNLFRNPSVAAVLLMPADYKVPDAPDKLVGVRLQLAPGLTGGRTLELAQQARVILRDLGFQEAVGYDHHGYLGRPFSRLVGTIPAGHVEDLLKDLRNQPSGWFSPRVARSDLPTPLRNLNPILITEVLPSFEPVVEPPLPPVRGDENLDKISADLWEVVKDKTATRVRLEVVLGFVPGPDDTEWNNRLLGAAPDFLIDGRLGQMVEGTAPANQVPNLAGLLEVSAVRLPRPPRVQVDRALKIAADNDRALRQSGLQDAHKRGFRGQGVRLAIVDTDFRGWEALVKDKKLPANTRLIDLTRVHNRNLRPTPYAGAATSVGHGVPCAEAAALAAPAAELTLVRIGGFAPLGMQQVARDIHGDFMNNNLMFRRDELISRKAQLGRDRAALMEEHKAMLENFDDYSDLEAEYGYLGAVRGWLFNPRVLHRQRMEYQDRMEGEFEEFAARFQRIVDDLRSLKGIRIVANPLVWNDGYPLGGTSALSRRFDALPGGTLWFQAGGNTRGQCWTGLYRDRDGNGVMEFAAPTTPLPKGRWTSELHCLGWQPYGGDRVADLPAQARLRVSMQWREPHDPAYFARPGREDLYRKPLANLRLVLLRQRDPDGKKVAADEFDVAARSWALPQRLDNEPTFGTYEQDFEFTIAQPGRYALRLERQLDARWVLLADSATGNPFMGKEEGLAPSGIRPLAAPALPALEKNWELKPRLFVEVTDDASHARGRPVFLDFPTDLGTVGVPADARGVITVGAADLNDRLEPYSAAGPPANLELFRKPDVFAYDSLRLTNGGAFGTSVSTAFAAGMAATLMSSKISRDGTVQYIRSRAGYVMRMPRAQAP